MIGTNKVHKLRSLIEKSSASLTDEEALSGIELFPYWTDGQFYEVGNRVVYNGILYKCIISHTSQADWIPTNAVSLWAKVLIPDVDIIPEWEQPDSTNPYMTGDKVKHNGLVWMSIMDYNVFEPGIYGWDEVT